MKMVAKNNERYKVVFYDFIYGYLKKNPCVDCGEENIIVLEFDHISDNKSYDISDMQKHSIKAVQLEIDKCEVVCTNCHRIRTAKRANWRVLKYV